MLLGASFRSLGETAKWEKSCGWGFTLQPLRSPLQRSRLVSTAWLEFGEVFGRHRRMKFVHSFYWAVVQWAFTHSPNKHEWFITHLHFPHVLCNIRREGYDFLRVWESRRRLSWSKLMGQKSLEIFSGTLIPNLNMYRMKSYNLTWMENTIFLHL